VTDEIYQYTVCASSPRWMVDEPAVYFAGVPSDSLGWRKARLSSYESFLANIEKLLPQSESLDRIRADFMTRMEELKAEIAEMEKKADG